MHVIHKSTNLRNIVRSRIQPPALKLSNVVLTVFDEVANKTEKLKLFNDSYSFVILMYKNAVCPNLFVTLSLVAVFRQNEKSISG